MTQLPRDWSSGSGESRVFELAPSRWAISLTVLLHACLLAGLSAAPGLTVPERVPAAVLVLGDMAWALSRHLLPGRGCIPRRLGVDVDGRWSLHWRNRSVGATVHPATRVGYNVCLVVLDQTGGGRRHLLIVRDMLPGEGHRRLRRLLLVS